MNQYQNLMGKLNKISERPIPLVVFGTRHARREYGPDLEAVAVDADCIYELEILASRLANVEATELKRLQMQSENYKLAGFAIADTFAFGTSDSQQVIQNLIANGRSLLDLFPPDATDGKIAACMEYSRVDRINRKIKRVVRRRQFDESIDESIQDVIRFQTESDLFPEAEEMNDRDFEGEPARQVSYSGDPEGESSRSDLDTGQKITKWLNDDWGAYRRTHWYFFHLTTTDLVAAVDDALCRSIGEPTTQKTNSSPVLSPEHPLVLRASRFTALYAIRSQNASSLYPEAMQLNVRDFEGGPARKCDGSIEDGVTPSLEIAPSEFDSGENGSKQLSDTEGTDGVKHRHVAHLREGDLDAAADDARHRSASEQSSQDARNWIGPSPEHPPDWRDSDLTAHVEPWPGEKKQQLSYGENGDLERDRWLFWKWQCGRHSWDDIIDAAMKMEFAIGRMTDETYQNFSSDRQRNALDNRRRTAGRYAESYARHFGLKKRKGRPTKNNGDS
ncbi:hypothetical protein NHH03_16360 [Stieleria sp. TO1_6]|uniref:hypothetical protein n=1 Tax=Stieleria tagensis TaxID=2956795 RepID=UPI00209B4075|nr:hypothetical protein [Stieleria tagensis]MCO8123324.1 hypothetical protein [Stieleria tagensis]